MIPWYLFALGGALFLALSEIAGKKVMLHEHALEFTTMRSLFVLGLNLTLIPFVRWELITPPIILLLYVASLIATAGLLYRMKAVRHLEVSYVAPLMNISPLFLIVLSVFILGEQISALQGLGIFIMLAGAYLLQGAHRHESIFAPLVRMVRSRHVHHLVFAMIALSILAIIDKFSIDNLGLGAATHMFVLWIFIGINLIGLEYLRFGFEDVTKDLPRDGKWIALAAGFFFVSILLGTLTLTLAPVSLAVPIRRTSALFSIIIGGRMFHERHIGRKLVAAILMVIGAALVIA